IYFTRACDYLTQPQLWTIETFRFVTRFRAEASHLSCAMIKRFFAESSTFGLVMLEYMKAEKASGTYVTSIWSWKIVLSSSENKGSSAMLYLVLRTLA